MDGTPRLSQTLVQVFSPQHNWVERRHLKTLAGMVVGRIATGHSRLTAWAPSGHSRAL
jgi:hypothetical protein